MPIQIWRAGLASVVLGLVLITGFTPTGTWSALLLIALAIPCGGVILAWAVGRVRGTFLMNVTLVAVGLGFVWSSAVPGGIDMSRFMAFAGGILLCSCVWLAQLVRTLVRSDGGELKGLLPFLMAPAIAVFTWVIISQPWLETIRFELSKPVLNRLADEAAATTPPAQRGADRPSAGRSSVVGDAGFMDVDSAYVYGSPGTPTVELYVKPCGGGFIVACVLSRNEDGRWNTRILYF